MIETATREVIFGKKEPKKTANTEFKRSLAIVIGIDSYSNGIPPLTTAVNDTSGWRGYWRRSTAELSSL